MTARARHCPCLVVPVPFGPDVLVRRHSGFYPGMLSNILDVNSLSYFYPIEDFVNAHLESRIRDERKDRSTSGCVLFNDAIGDDHFSAAGSEVWGASVGHRLILLLEDEGVIGKELLESSARTIERARGAGVCRVSRHHQSSSLLRARCSVFGGPIPSTPHQNKAPAATITPASPRLSRQPRSGP